MADSSAVAQSDEERVLGPPIASLVRAGLIIPGLGRHADQSRDTLLGYARTLPAAELAPLYACPWCTQSMVQGLEATSRQVLMRLCTINSAVSEALVATWFVGKGSESAAASVQELVDMKMLSRSVRPVKALLPSGAKDVAADAVKVRAVVRQRVQELLSAPPSRPWDGFTLRSSVPPSLPAAEAVTDASEASAAIAAVREAAHDAASCLARSDVEATAARRWHAVLSFLVGEPGAPAPPPDVLTFLLVSGLLVPLAEAGEAAFRAQVEEAERAPAARGAADEADADDDDGDDAGASAGDTAALLRATKAGKVHLAPRGYRFLLADTERQLWTIVRHYASSRRARAADPGTGQSYSSSSSGGDAASPGTVVRLLMRLGHCRPGEPVALDVLDAAERTVLRDLESLGVVVVDGPGAAAARASAAAASLAAELSEPDESGEHAFGAVARRAATAEAERIASLCGAAAPGPGEDAADRFYVSSLAAVLLSSAPQAVGGGGAGSEDTAEAAAAAAAARDGGPSSSSAAARFRLTAQGWSGGLEGRAVSLSRVEARARVEAAAGAAASAGLGALAARPSEVRLQIYVERNFRLYAMTQESVHARLLGVFSNVEFRLPNMVVCRLTRSSVGRALDLGVSAVTIRDFLDRHAHPRAAAAGMAVPDNVKDQIYLWEMERKRLVVTKAIELSNFKNDPEWETTIGFLRERGALLSEDEPRRLLWCREDAMRDLNNHIVAWRTANPSLA